MEMSTLATNNSLWKNRSFVRLWCGTLFSAMADGAFFILLNWYIVNAMGSGAILGTTLICLSIPRLLFMLAGGVAADRLNRKWIMFSSLLVRGIILACFSLLMLQGNSDWFPVSLYVMAALFGTVDAFFWPARSSILPSLVSREQLAPANSLMELCHQISMVAGPVVTALLIGTVPYPTMFMILACTFFVGTLFVLSLHSHSYTKDTTSESTTESRASSYFKDIVGGIRFTYSIPILALILTTSLFTNMMFSGPVNMIIPIHVNDLGWDGSAFSSLSTSLGVGMIIGGILTALCKGFRGNFMLLPVILGCMGVGISSYYFIEELSFGLVSHFLIGMALSMTNIPFITYIQSIVPANMLGRVMSLLSLMSIGFGPVSYALCSFLLAKNITTPRLLLFFGGIMFVSISLSLFFFRSFRQMEQHPNWKRTAMEEQQLPATLSS
ncbi:MFS transporter [Brevibacillus antibioticus]|uniref:MFS transporter n=1 Tax=Brevibacillus antibioticus TaxID=2570228 RepID=A0A4V5TIL9_9BACL|nr:MFS transporter [Brevibacillus antibioticus]TKI54423.1 MFS transporter [Brevibacillus antibioticus]